MTTTIVPYAYFEQRRQTDAEEKSSSFVLDHRNANWQYNCLCFESYSATLDENLPQYFASDIFTVASVLHNSDVFQFYAHDQQAYFPFDITCWFDDSESASDVDFVRWLCYDFRLQPLAPNATRFDRLQAMHSSRAEIEQYISSCLPNAAQRWMVLSERYIRWRYVYCLLALELVYSLGEYLFSPKPFIYSRITVADDLFSQYTRMRYAVEKNVKAPNDNEETLTYVWWLLKTTNDAYKSRIDTATRSEDAVHTNASQLEILLIYRFLAVVHIRPHLEQEDSSPSIVLVHFPCDNGGNTSKRQFSTYARWFQTSMLTWIDCSLPAADSRQMPIPFYHLMSSFNQPVLLTMHFDLRSGQNANVLNRHKQSAYAFRTAQDSFRQERHQQYAPLHQPVVRLLRDHCARKKSKDDSPKISVLSNVSIVVGWLKKKSRRHYTRVHPDYPGTDYALRVGDVLALLVYHNNHCSANKVGFLKFAYYELANIFQRATKMQQITKTIWLRNRSFLRPLLRAYRRYIALLRKNGKKNSLYHVRIGVALSSTPILHDLLDHMENNV